MNTVVDLKMLLLQRIRPLDVELAEDLYRRMPEMNQVEQLSNYFHMLLASYTQPTLDMRTTLDSSVPFEVWCASFQRNILPFLMKRRLPPCTDSSVGAMYQCESKQL